MNDLPTPTPIPSTTRISATQVVQRPSCQVAEQNQPLFKLAPQKVPKIQPQYNVLYYEDHLEEEMKGFKNGAASLMF